MQAVSDHKFSSIADAKAFALAGNAIITLQSLRTGAHFTYKIRLAKDGDAHFVSLLSNGSADEGDFRYLGLIKNGMFRLTRNSKVNEQAASYKAFEWFWNMVRDGIPTELVVRHEGKCGRCGRTLTVPESIDQGIGPECIKQMGGAL